MDSENNIEIDNLLNPFCTGWNDEPFSIQNLLCEMGKQKSSATLFRDDVIREIFSILISETKPSALLVGPAGCGKTNIAEEIARRIRWKTIDVPHMLFGYKLYSVNLADIISGCSLVGDLEKKVKALVDYLESDEHKVILFLDEVHMLSKGDDSYKKVAQMLKPALSRGRFKVIAATTTQEVKQIEDDPAFNRRFTRVLVDELTREQTITVLQRTVKSMEKHYKTKIHFDSDVAELIVRTADEFYSAGSHRPDNAITLMDRAVASSIINRQITKTDSEIELTKELITDTAFRLTSGNSRVRKFNEKIFRESISPIRGQDDILDDIIKTLKLYDLHLRPRNKPLTLLFAGPSGVGKTETAKIIAREYFGEKPIILNMTEYSSPASINRITGAPAGLVGSDSNRELPFDILDTNPYQVILLDEFEKCDKSVQRLFLSVFDEGSMKTSFGKEIDFSKSIIIATINGACTSKAGKIGFLLDNERENISTSDLSEFMDIELLSRFTNRYSFRSIDFITYKHIINDLLNHEIDTVVKGLSGETISDCLKNPITDSQIEDLAKSSYDPKLGARPAQNAIREYVDSILLKMIDSHTITSR